MMKASLCFGIFSSKDTYDYLQNRLENFINFGELMSWLQSPPRITSVRVNFLENFNEIKLVINEHLLKQSKVFNRTSIPNILDNSYFPEMILINSWCFEDLQLDLQSHRVIVDKPCGEAILRGANVFAPGILSMPSDVKIKDQVSIFVVISGVCKKGSKCFEGITQFIGNGIMQMNRRMIFGPNPHTKGLAIEMTNPISGCINLNQASLDTSSILLQNIPSIVTGRVLDPQPNETILDMCASPGNKTTHLAFLMKDQGTLIALDKTGNKIKRINEKIKLFKLKSIQAYEYDSTKAVSTNTLQGTLIPPFYPGTFDRILLDAPCSGLGQRPQLINNIKLKELKSYIPLQKKLFKIAVELLKIEGRLVYSTCTITLEENEELVAWALKSYPCLQLEPAIPRLGGPGYLINGLTSKEVGYLQRFGPTCESDSVGFFIASFKKISIN